MRVFETGSMPITVHERATMVSLVTTTLALFLLFLVRNDATSTFQVLVQLVLRHRRPSTTQLIIEKSCTELSSSKRCFNSSMLLLSECDSWPPIFVECGHCSCFPKCFDELLNSSRREAIHGRHLRRWAPMPHDLSDEPADLLLVEFGHVWRRKRTYKGGAK